jgi:hypothetical protein
MNTIVFGEPKKYIVKGGVCKRIYLDGESHCDGEIPIHFFWL